MELLLAAILTLSLATVLITIAVCDIKSRRIPNVLILALLGLGLLFCATLDRSEAIGRLGGCFALLGGGYAFSVVAERIYRKPSLGMGDVKLFAVSSLWIGLGSMAMLLVLSSGLALFVIAMRSGTIGTQVAFGPYLAVGIMALWCIELWGHAA